MTKKNRQNEDRIILPEQEGTIKLEDKVIYLIGSLKNRKLITPLAKELRKLGVREVFEDWIAPGPEADDFWRDYEKEKGRNYGEALKGWAGKHIYEFDSFHIERADLGILCMPCGKSGHLEFGDILGSGKRGYILFNGEPERWDVMYQFADGIYFNKKELKKELIENGWKPTERKGFANIFSWFNNARNQGMNIAEAKKYVKDKIKEMMQDYRGYEKIAFQERYTSAMELLK